MPRIKFDDSRPASLSAEITWKYKYYDKINLEQSISHIEGNKKKKKREMNHLGKKSGKLGSLKLVDQATNLEQRALLHVLKNQEFQI